MAKMVHGLEPTSPKGQLHVPSQLQSNNNKT